jgi:hypothetical protein
LEEGASIFIDANIFIYHFSKGSKFNPASSSFLERAERGSISGFTSTARFFGPPLIAFDHSPIFLSPDALIKQSLVSPFLAVAYNLSPIA